MSFALSGAAPGVYNQEVNPFSQVSGTSTTVGCLTGGFKRGPLGPFLLTAPGGYATNYGAVDTSWGYAGVAANAYLASAASLLINRVVDPPTCTYACADVFNAGNLGTSNNFTYILPGSILDFPVANAPIATANEMYTMELVLNQPLTTGASVQVTCSAPAASGNSFNAITIPAVAFASNSDNTMAILANTISQALNAAGIPCVASTLNNTNASTCLVVKLMFALNNLVSNNGNNIEFAATVTGGTAGTTLIVQQNELLQIFARDPGSFGNSIGVNFSAANTLTPPSITSTFTYVTATDSFALSAVFNNNGTNVAVHSATTANIGAAVQAFIAAYNASMGGDSAAYYTINTTSKIVVITFYGPKYNVPLTVSNAGLLVTDTTTTTIISVVSVANQNSSLNSFMLNVYLNGSLTPVESFVCSLQKQLDGFGNQQFVEDVVNTGVSGPPSNYIRVNYSGGIYNPIGNISPSFKNGTSLSASSAIVYLGGGQDGAQPTDSEIINGINNLVSTEDYSFQLVINAGYTDVAVQQAIVALCETRQDCFYILDMPSNVQTDGSTEAVYASSTVGINSTRGSIFTPDAYILDTTSNSYFYCPPSGHVAARFAATDTNFAVWLSAAGLKRGTLNNVVKLRVNYTAAQRKVLAGANICPIKPARNGSGVVIYDVLTMSTPRTPLSYSSIRRTFIYLEQNILTALEGNVFDNINDQTEFLITQEINAFLQPIKDQEGIDDFFVLCNSINNTASSTDAAQLNVTVYILPVFPARIIALTTVVDNNSVSFQELITSGIF